MIGLAAAFASPAARSVNAVVRRRILLDGGRPRLGAASVTDASEEQYPRVLGWRVRARRARGIRGGSKH